MEKAFQAANEAGIPVVNCGPGGKSDDEETFQQSIDSLGSLADRAETYGVTLCVKAHVGAAIYNTPTTLRAMEAISSPAFGIDMDPSHIHRANENPVEAIAAVVSRVKHVHIRDCKGRERGPGDPENQANGRGDIDLVGYIRVLHENGYDGPVNLEVIAPSTGTQSGTMLHHRAKPADTCRHPCKRAARDNWTNQTNLPSNIENLSPCPINQYPLDLGEDLYPDLACYGTPAANPVLHTNIDKFASEGTLFTMHLSPAGGSPRQIHHHRPLSNQLWRAQPPQQTRNPITEHIRLIPDNFRDAGFYTCNSRDRPLTIRQNRLQLSQRVFDGIDWTNAQRASLYAQINHRPHRTSTPDRKTRDPDAVEIPPYYPIIPHQERLGQVSRSAQVFDAKLAVPSASKTTA